MSDRSWKLPLAGPIEAEDIEAACACLRGRWLTQGPRVREFEVALSGYTVIPGMVAVNSGSSALLLIAHALAKRYAWTEPRWLGEVIVPALCWSTTAWPFRQMGFRVVLADIEPETLALDLGSAERARTDETKAAVLVHVMGLAADEDAFSEWCTRACVESVADCCESFGAHSPSHEHVGAAVDWSAWSFYASHTLTTIEGGAVGGPPGAEDGLRIARAHGWDRDVPGGQDRTDWRFVGDGFNLRMTEPQAAIGLSQLARFEATARARRRVARDLIDILSPLAWLSSPFASLMFGTQAEPIKGRGRFRCVPMFLPLMVAEGAPASRDRVREVLHEAGVETRPIAAGNLARHPAARGLVVADRVPLTNADAVADRGLMVGCWPATGRDGMDALADAVRRLRSL